MNNWEFRVGRAILMMFIVLVAGCHPQAEVAGYQTSMTRALAAGKLVAPDEKLKVPLLMVFDAAGDLVNVRSGWNGAQSLDHITRHLTQTGEGARLEDVRLALGQEAATSSGPVVLAISLGPRCPPCVAMEQDLAKLAAQRTEATFEVHLVTLIPAD